MDLMLWGKEICVDVTTLAINQLSRELKEKVQLGTNKMISNRINGVPAKVETINGKKCMSVVPYVWDNIDYIEKDIMVNIRDFVYKTLSAYGINLVLNWTVINQEWKNKLSKIGEAFANAQSRVGQAALNGQAIKYNQVYNQELSKDFGLNFGIISNSLAAHLIYAAQAVAKERKDIARAEKAASESIQSFHEEVTIAIYEATYPIYVNQIEPALIEFLGNYYAHVVSLITEKLGLSYDNIDLSEVLGEDAFTVLNNNAINDKEKILKILTSDISSGEAVLYAIQQNLIDDDFVCFFVNAPQILKTNTKNAVVKHLTKKRRDAQFLNTEIISEEIEIFINNLKKLLNKNTIYYNIIETVYEDEINKICNTFSTLIQIYDDSDALTAYVEEGEEKSYLFKPEIQIFKSEIQRLIFFNEVLEIPRFANILKTLNYQGDIAYIQKIISDVNRKLKEEHKHIKEINRVKREKELEQKKEIEKKKNEIKADISKMIAEIESLGFAWFGKKAQRKAELNALITEKTRELNSIK